jgi:hypothetical protein
MRGNVLNKKLSRLVVDCKWEERMWKEAWAPRGIDINEEFVRESTTNKRKESGRRKRLKLESGEAGSRIRRGVGEEEVSICYSYYCYNTEGAKETRDHPVTEWPKDMQEFLKGGSKEHCGGERSGRRRWQSEEIIKRSLKEEKRLWGVLDECGREQAKGRRGNSKGEKVQQARLRMKAGEDQPSMKEMMMVSKGVVPGDCLSGITARTRVSLDKVVCKG